MSDEEEGSDLIYTSNLEELLRNMGEDDTQMGSDARAYMEVQVENICREVWQQAEKNTLDQDKKRVTEAEVHVAFDEVFYPYALIEDSITKLGEYKLELERVTDNYPVLEFEEPEVEDEDSEDENSEDEQ